MATKSLGRVSIVPQGDYDENKVYKRLDLVKDDGKTYLSLKEDNTDVLSDTDSWMLLTESGKFEDLTPQELETLLQPLNEAAEAANTAAENANEAAENALTGISGEATQSNSPEPTGFHRYIVTTPITTGSTWGIEVTQAELNDNWVFFNVKDGVITKELKPIQAGRGITSIAKTSTVGEVDTYTITFSDATTSTFSVTNGTNAKLSLYSAIKSANIAAGTQFIDDENGNIQYRVKTGQTLNVGELPANMVGTKVEQIGGSGEDGSLARITQELNTIDAVPITVAGTHVALPDAGKRFILEANLIANQTFPATSKLTQIKVIGKNKLDLNPTLWETGWFDPTTGAPTSSGSQIRPKSIIPILSSTPYQFNQAPSRIVIYKAGGVVSRVLPSAPPVTSFTSAADEVGVRMSWNKTGASPLEVPSYGFQMEIGLSVTAFEQYVEKIYKFKNHSLRKIGDKADELHGQVITRRISNVPVILNGTNNTWNNVPTDLGTHWRIYIQSPDIFINNNIKIKKAGSGLGVNSETDFPVQTDIALDQRGIVLDGARLYLKIEKTRVDSFPPVGAVDKIKAYLTANPISLWYELANESKDQVLNSVAYVPKNSTVVVEGENADSVSLDFKAISAGGGGSIDPSILNNYALKTITDGLQNQINTLVVGGDSSTEAAQARTSVLNGKTYPTLKARLDAMESRQFVDVKAFGAVGDGVTDDTEAVLAANVYAQTNKLILLFTPGTYMMRRTLYLNNAQHVVGMRGSKLKKFPAITQTLAGGVTAGQTVITVPDASQYAVGMDVCITVDDKDEYWINQSRIVGINGNNITIVGYKAAGLTTSYPSAVKFSNSFAMVSSNDGQATGSPEPKYDIRIEGLTLDGNKQGGEPKNYSLSVMHFEPRSAGRLYIADNTVLNSPADGISDQTTGESFIINNRVNDSEVNGIHIGFTINRTLVHGNIIKGVKNLGMFWCYGVEETIVTSNFFVNCQNGCAGIDGYDSYSVIANNFFINTVFYDVGITGAPGKFLITGNIFRGNKNVAIYSRLSTDMLIANNTFTDCIGKGIELQCQINSVVDNNLFVNHLGATAIDISRDVAGTRKGKDLVVKGNTIFGCTSYPIILSDVEDVNVSLNKVKTSFTHALNMTGTNVNTKFLFNDWGGKLTNTTGTTTVHDY